MLEPDRTDGSSQRGRQHRALPNTRHNSLIHTLAHLRAPASRAARMYLGRIGNLGQQHFRASELEYVINA
jgi:hypothetical protein